MGRAARGERLLRRAARRQRDVGAAGDTTGASAGRGRGARRARARAEGGGRPAAGGTEAGERARGARGGGAGGRRARARRDRESEPGPQRGRAAEGAERFLRPGFGGWGVWCGCGWCLVLWWWCRFCWWGLFCCLLWLGGGSSVSWCVELVLRGWARVLRRRWEWWRWRRRRGVWSAGAACWAGGGGVSCARRVFPSPGSELSLFLFGVSSVPASFSCQSAVRAAASRSLRLWVQSVSVAPCSFAAGAGRLRRVFPCVLSGRVVVAAPCWRLSPLRSLCVRLARGRCGLSARGAGCPARLVPLLLAGRALWLRFPGHSPPLVGRRSQFSAGAALALVVVLSFGFARVVARFPRSRLSPCRSGCVSRSWACLFPSCLRSFLVPFVLSRASLAALCCRFVLPPVVCPRRLRALGFRPGASAPPACFCACLLFLGFLPRAPCALFCASRRALGGPALARRAVSCVLAPPLVRVLCCRLASARALAPLSARLAPSVVCAPRVGAGAALLGPLSFFSLVLASLCWLVLVSPRWSPRSGPPPFCFRV